MNCTLVLLPGMDGTGRLFGSFLDHLRDQYPALVVTYPAAAPTCSRPELLQRIEECLPPEGEYVLVAESFSGSLAIEHASTSPDRLRALVLVASFAASPLPKGLRWIRAFAGAARVRPPRVLLRVLLVGSDADQGLVDEVGVVLDTVAPQVLADRLCQVLSVDVRSLLPSIAVPVLYLRGLGDRLVSSRGSAQFEGVVQSLTVVELNGPHLLLQARPRESAEAIVRFLEGVSPPVARMPT